MPKKNKVSAEMEKRIDAYCDLKYKVTIQWIEDDGEGYFLAYLPDWGHSAVSATADTPRKAFKELEKMKRAMVQYYLENDKPIPVASGFEKAAIEGVTLKEGGMSAEDFVAIQEALGFTNVRIADELGMSTRLVVSMRNADRAVAPWTQKLLRYIAADHGLAF
jgi:predicted RNase H-like HicB family nuclease